MKHVVAAIDSGPVSAAVIAMARFLAPIFDSSVEIVTTEEACRHAVYDDVQLLSGDAPTALVDYVSSSEEVTCLVLGMRTVAAGPRPAGHVTITMITSCSIPVVVVPPPNAAPTHEVRRVLVPLEGNSPPSTVLNETVERFTAAGLDIDTVHVFDSSNVPMFWNGWDDPGLWAEQFSQQFSPAEGRTGLLTGNVGQRLREAIDATHSSLVLLEWKRQLDESGAAVVRELLATSGVPLMLLPSTGAHLKDSRT